MLGTSKVRKAVILAAGLGTRFLPATKAIPKELLPVLDKPVIQYLVEEMADSGIREVIIVISPQKKAIIDHFTRDLKFEKFLKEKNKYNYLAPLVELVKKVKITYVYQREALGNGHALLMARKAVGNESFVLSDGDSIIAGSSEPAVKQLLKVFAEVEAPVIGVQKIKNKQEMTKYGNVYSRGTRNGERGMGKTYLVQKFFEKPDLKDVSKQGLIIGGMRYVLTPDIWPILAKTKSGRAGEIWFLDAANTLAQSRDFYAYEYSGRYFDTGDKWALMATAKYFLDHDSSI